MSLSASETLELRVLSFQSLHPFIIFPSHDVIHTMKLWKTHCEKQVPCPVVSWAFALNKICHVSLAKAQISRELVVLLMEVFVAFIERSS